MRTYGSVEVIEMLGITYRQLNHWIATGLVPGQARGPGSGKGRQFTAEDIERLRWVKSVRDQIDALQQQLEEAKIEIDLRPGHRYKDRSWMHASEALIRR